MCITEARSQKTWNTQTYSHSYGAENTSQKRTRKWTATWQKVIHDHISRIKENPM